MISSFDSFEEIVVIDTEFTTSPGEPPRPLCLAYHELRSGRTGVVLGTDLNALRAPPFRMDSKTLVVAHYAIAEVVVMLVLGWPLPTNIVDTYVEFRNHTNSDPSPRAGLLDAAAHFGIHTMADTTKAAMRDLALRAGHTAEEMVELGRYCMDDVDATVRLFHALAEHIDVPRALLRGRFAIPAARTELLGLPVDAPLANEIVERQDEIALTLVREVDTPGAFDGTSLRQQRIGELARARRLPWPRTPSGLYSTEHETLVAMARLAPDLRPIVEAVDLLASLRLVELPIGRDGRARTGLRPFATKTSRGAPRAREFLPAQSAWRRGLVVPQDGMSLAYLDYEQQEFGIAAALSGDDAMWADYLLGDPYIAFAIRMQHAPADATKASHGPVRDIFKTVILGVQYSMSAPGLARRLGVSRHAAARYLALHHAAYPRFWRWNDAIVIGAQTRRSIRTVFGWTFRPSVDTNPRTLRNFPMQATGAEILRVACTLGWERGVSICAPVHDAVLIEAPTTSIETAIAVMSKAMVDASEVVIGRPLRVSHEIIDRMRPWLSRGARPMWERVNAVLRKGRPT